MSEILVDIGGVSITLGAALVFCAALLMAVMLVVVVVVVRAAGAGGRDADRQAMRGEELEDRISQMAQVQSETAGRLKTMGDVLAGRQAELARIVNERLDAMSGRIGQSMTDTANQTVDRLQKLHERLAVIDSAQKNITDLSQQVTSLRDVLSNKQVRGAFRAGADGGDHPRRAAERQLRVPAHALQRHPARLWRAAAGRPPAGDRRQVSVGGCDRVSRGWHGRHAQTGRAAYPQRSRRNTSPTFRKSISYPGRRRIPR